MNIVFEYQVIYENLTCVVTKVLGVFQDYDIAKDFYHREVNKRGLNPEMLLKKQVGDTGVFFMSEEVDSCLFIDLHYIENLYNYRVEMSKQKIMERREEEMKRSINGEENES